MTPTLPADTKPWTRYLHARMRAAVVVASVSIGHPEWTEAQKQAMRERLYYDLLRASKP